MKNIVTLKQLPKLIKKLQNRRIVLVGGSFDILHIGHITFLEKAKKQGDILMVLLESDESIKKRKGETRPIHTQVQRAKILSELLSVDYVILLPTFTKDIEYDTVVKTIQPAIIAVTKGDSGTHNKKRQAKNIGATVKIVTNHIANASTSRLLDIIEKELRT